MRHVIVMTSTGMIGLTFMFLVDAVTLFWVAQLGVEMFIAAMGYAWAIQLATISMGIALMIAAIALVAKSMGQENWEQARQQATSSIVISVAVLSVAVLFILPFREPILRLVGAEGETLEVASKFLLISVPTIPVMVVGMVGSGLLRAEGDALRSMVGTTSMGVVAMIVDPLFIYGFDMGVQGAALGISVSRTASTILVLYFISSKNLLAPLGQTNVRTWLVPFALIALPSLLTQMSSPAGNFIATTVISEAGESAVAGWAVMNRILVLAFGGVFALSGVVGGIVGQNYGAQKFDRVRQTFWDAILVSCLYVMAVWALLAIFTYPILWVFDVEGQAADVVRSFTYYAAAGFIFASVLYVANASFNNLGRPIFSTYLNWFKDGVLMFPLSIIGLSFFGAVGVVYAMGLAWLFSGLVGGYWAWRFILKLEQKSVNP